MRGAIILTVQFDEAADAYFQELRRRHFPAALNRVGAHLTLFHNLPATEELDVVRETAREAAACAPFEVTATGPIRLGRGVAIAIDSQRLLALRARLAAAFKSWLSGQDREKFRPHVTVQNKVAPHEAALLHDHLAATFAPFEATAQGVQLWRYRGGPWAPIGAIAFAAAPGAAAKR